MFWLYFCFPLISSIMYVFSNMVSFTQYMWVMKVLPMWGLHAACSLFPHIPPSISIRIQSLPPHFDWLDWVWANASPRPNSNHILYLKQAKLLLTLLIHLKCIRNKCAMCEETFFNLLITYSRDSEGWTCSLVFSFHFHVPQFWLECLPSA